MPFCFLPDLTRVKFGSACPPLGRCYRVHPPGQALPNFQPAVSPQPPLPYGLRLQAIGPINLPLADCSDGPPAPGFRGWCGGSEATGSNTTPSLIPMPFCFLPDLTRVKSGSARLPLGGCYRAHPPGQPLPNLRPSGSPQPPLPFACASGNRTDQPATGRSLRRSYGTRLSRAVQAIRGNPP